MLKVFVFCFLGFKRLCGKSMITWKTSSLNLKTFTVQKELKDDWENWTQRRASGTPCHYFVDVKLVTPSTTSAALWTDITLCFLWPELNWLPGLHGELMRVGSKKWSLAVSCVFLLLENMVSFAGLPFISLSSSHAHGRMELDSCVCVHTCINFVDFNHIQMASLTRCLWIQTLGTQM